MDANFTNIDEYIAQFDGAKQQLLQDIRQAIREAAPEAKETISYQMPTFRQQGNLIHFAMAKQHLGIYPGPAAISHYSDQLAGYKTSKGAIQIAFDQALPIKLIQDIVRFNLQQQEGKTAPDWKKFEQQWTDAIHKTKEIIQQLPLTRTLKWGGEVYTFQGKNVVSYGGFKNHFAIWFYNGVFLEDREQLLSSGTAGKTKALRQWRFMSAEEMDARKIKRYLEEAIQTVLNQKELKPEKGKTLLLEGVLQEALAKDEPFATAFYKLTPGRQREYGAFIDEAKQEKTKLARLEKIRPLVCAGKGLHDKYKT